MVNLATKYMGIELKNPIIVGSSSLTGTVDSIKEMADAGAGAVVLKSLFEEHIMLNMNKDIGIEDSFGSHTEMHDYLHFFEKQHIIDKYISLIKDAKKSVDIPIIASINCMSSTEWIDFALEIEKAGADGLELNIFILPTDPKVKDDQIKQTYLKIIRRVTETINIPVAIKIGSYFDNVASSLQQLSWTKIKGMVLFNKFVTPDIDIDKLEVITGYAFTSPNDKAETLRWIGVMSELVDCDLCATTGVHNGKDAIKMLLAGASVVQMVSTIYKNSSKVIEESLVQISDWMKKHQYESIEQFKGKLGKKADMNNSLYERVQFIKQLQS